MESETPIVSAAELHMRIAAHGVLPDEVVVDGSRITVTTRRPNDVLCIAHDLHDAMIELTGRATPYSAEIRLTDAHS